MAFALSGMWTKAGALFASRFVLLLALWLSAAGAGSAQTLRGVALVIGNSAYRHLSALPNPANDARAIESLLNDLGFETELSSDRDGRRLVRDLRDFIEDAEGTDVAVIYYAGHGIEAGGENFLVPVDADLSALEAAGEKLVPISSFIEQLQATVPLTIVMLDACRGNPFPSGAMVRLDASAEPLPIGEAGLGETRGAQRLTEPEPGVESFGTVIGFAAEPGRAALDGEPGGNSPYSAAILRHLEAMAGEEFGAVMRMVGEEVYLKTSGRQRPWVNENLRRLLYFGRALAPVAGEEGTLLTERRQFLLTIAALPDAASRRAQVERVAAQGGVPLDAVYGILRAMGGNVPDDPTELEEALRNEAERFARVLAEREAINSPDADIMRLTALADRAEREGLLSSADAFRERAKARVQELRPMREAQEALLRQRNIEDASVYARSAETKALNFDHLTAAGDYAEAFRIVERWDDRLAWRYKLAEAWALIDHGNYKGDNAALERAIAAGRLAVSMTSREATPLDWALTQLNLGNALATLGQRQSDTVRLEEAVVAYRAALQERTRERAPLDWARTQNNLGNALSSLGGRDSGTARLEQAVVAYRAALHELTRERVPLQWAATQNNLGNALRALGQRESGAARLEEAIDAYRAALQEFTRERAPRDWATTQNNLGNALWRSANARAARRGWRRPSPPIALRWKSAPASACRSTGRERRTISAMRSGPSASARAARRGWSRRSSPIAPRFRSAPASASRSTGRRRRTISAAPWWKQASGRGESPMSRKDAPPSLPRGKSIARPVIPGMTAISERRSKRPMPCWRRWSEAKASG